MTEYWKSYAKKFCEICKCWYADNKVSAERHEQGLRHKAMVQQRLRESAKKAKDKEVENHELRMTLLAMEQAARASISSREEREVPMGPAPRIITSQKRTVEPIEEDDVKAKLKEQKRKLAELKRRSKKSQFWSTDEGDDEQRQTLETEDGDTSVGSELAEWVQADTPDGQFYYWHIYTGETRWNQPEKFYTSAQYNEHYAVIVTQASVGGQCAISADILAQSSDFSYVGTSQTAHSELIDPNFVHQMTAAEVDRQIAPTNDEAAPPPVKKYYGMREKSEIAIFDGGRPNGRRAFDADAHDNAEQQTLTREERRKIRRERKAMSDKADDGSHIPEGLVELKVETPLATMEEAAASEEVTKPSSIPKFSSSHPLGPWVPVKKEEKSLDTTDTDELSVSPQGRKRTKRYDDLPEQSYGPGLACYSQTPAELLEVAEMDPEDLEFKTKQMGQQKPQKSTAKGKVVGFRKPGTNHATKSLRPASKAEF